MKAEQPDPNTIVYFDNRFVPLAEAHVNILTHALNYGTGVFEGIRGYWNSDAEDLSPGPPGGALRPLEEERRHPAHRHRPERTKS